jgi:adenine phosphoribosyltransferase
MTIEEKIKKSIRDIPDFPKEGIIFKDITPILQKPQLCKEIIDDFYDRTKDLGIGCVAAVESRGFLFGMLLAQKLNVPFVPIRKKGKLPFSSHKQNYDLEYGSATIEMHLDAIQEGQSVLLHDDLLATGGTMEAASKLILKAGGTISAFTFLINLRHLKGGEKLNKYCRNLIGLAQY